MTKLLTCVAGLALLVACSSSEDPTPAGDAGAADAADAADAAPSGPCTADKKRVAEEESGVCCAGLFKACVSGSRDGISPCICSTVECGTAAMQPPPNVPCCPMQASNCSTTLTGPNAGETQCKCGP